VGRKDRDVRSVLRPVRRRSAAAAAAAAVLAGANAATAAAASASADRLRVGADGLLLHAGEVSDWHPRQGRSDGGYIGIYIFPKKLVNLTNFYVVSGTLTCFDFEIGMTS